MEFTWASIPSTAMTQPFSHPFPFLPIPFLSSLSLENLFISAGFLLWRHRFDCNALPVYVVGSALEITSVTVTATVTVPCSPFPLSPPSISFLPLEVGPLKSS